MDQNPTLRPEEISQLLNEKPRGRRTMVVSRALLEHIFSGRWQWPEVETTMPSDLRIIQISMVPNGAHACFLCSSAEWDDKPDEIFMPTYTVSK